MSSWNIKILFDGACPFCKREVAFLQRRNRRGQLAFADIAAPDFDPEAYGATLEQLNSRIHAQLPDGQLITGLEVFRRAYAAVGLGFLLAPTGWPGLRPFCDMGYRWFARHRVRLGRFFGGHKDDDACSCQKVG